MTTAVKKKKARFEELKAEVLSSEAYFTSIFWNNPEFYEFYPKEKLNKEHFANEVWGFYFGLGQYMYSDKKLRIFDDLSVEKYVEESKSASKNYEKFGGYETILEVMREVKNKEDNLEAYLEDIKKYGMIRELYDLFGELVITKTEKYDHRKMTREILFKYWNDKLNQISLDSGSSGYEEADLLADLEEAVKEWNTNPARGLPFFNSKYMTNISTGWDFGNLYILGGFGGSGKTSMSFNKVIMSCIEEREKLAVIANEQSVMEFKKMLLITAMGEGTKKSVDRQKLNEGDFSEEDFEKLNKAIAWVKEISGGDTSLIKFIFMENYVMDDVKKIIRRYASRGYGSIMIDTGKPSEDGLAMARWERFTEDFKELYKITRPNGGGLNLRMWVNVQLADSALTRKFLNEHAFGDSKKIKNEASVVFMIRGVHDDEYEGGGSELECYNFPDENKKKIRHDFKLQKGTKYYLLFTPKNRRGKDNKTGLDVLILKPDFEHNTWEEIGWTTVYDDKGY